MCIKAPKRASSYYGIGTLASLALHLLLIVVALGFEPSGASLSKPVVYSVSLEGGRKLGGISQAPSKKKSEKAPPKKVQATAKPKPQKKEKTTPSKVKKQDPKPKRTAKEDTVSLTEKKPKNEVAKKKSTATKKTVTNKKDHKPSVKKKAATKPKQPSKAEINKQLQRAMQRYLGESSDAGGQGFGAGRLGGQGMGGGVLRPPEFFTYKRLLEGYIKAGWRWPNRRQALVARVAMQLEPDGRVLNIELVSPSGNSEFDESVLRAVRKSSPVPPAPSSVYGKYFRNVTITFDPRE